MRFPVSAKYADTNETLDIQDHKMVFQLGNVLNQMNGNASDLLIKFIPWIQSSPNVPGNSNGYRLPNGRIPSVAQIRANSSLVSPSATSPDNEIQSYAAEALEEFIGVTPAELRKISTNVYRAHKEAVEKGLFHWSETAYLRYSLNVSSNLVDFMAGSLNKEATSTLSLAHLAPMHIAASTPCVSFQSDLHGG